MTTKKSTKRIALLTSLVLITSLFIGGTIARYVTSTSSEDEARVAVWGINADGLTEMDLFNATYTTEDGTTVAQSNNGTDKIIAPGTHKDNQFSIVNTDANLAPEVMYEIRINLDDSEIDQRILDNPSIQWRLDEGTYGTWEETKAKILALSGHESGVKTYAPGDAEHEFKSGKTHTIGWQWLMDNGTDELDTAMGNAITNGDIIKATIKVSVTARQVDVDTTGLLNGNNSVYNINNPMPLIFRSVAPANELQKVIVNNEELTINEDYTVESGSTIITLLKAFLDNLPKGNYTIKIVSEDITVNATFTVAELPVEHSGTIPVGGTYYRDVQCDDFGNSTNVGDYTGYTNKYTAGESFPEPQIGDVYVYGDYEYRYNMQFTFDDDTYSNSYWYKLYGEFLNNGWGVRVLDTTKTIYEEIIPEINGKPITDLDMAFTNCVNLIEAPEIPSTVINMEHTYVNCTSLKKAKNLPNTVKLAEYLFYNCPALEEAPKLSNNVKDYDSAFYGCSSLTKMPEIPNGVEKMGNMFENCTSLVETTTIPNSVYMLSYTFQNCTSLRTAPVIPESVDYLYATFKGCTNLTGTIEINSTPFSYPNALKGTQITEITGACSDNVKEQLLATR